MNWMFSVSSKAEPASELLPAAAAAGAAAVPLPSAAGAGVDIAATARMDIQGGGDGKRRSVRHSTVIFTKAHTAIEKDAHQAEAL